MTLTVASDDLIAHVAKVAEKLVIVLLAVRQTLLLVMPMPVERLLAFRTYEMLTHKYTITSTNTYKVATSPVHSIHVSLIRKFNQLRKRTEFLFLPSL